MPYGRNPPTFDPHRSTSDAFSPYPGMPSYPALSQGRQLHTSPGLQPAQSDVSHYIPQQTYPSPTFVAPSLQLNQVSQEQCNKWKARLEINKADVAYRKQRIDYWAQRGNSGNVRKANSKRMKAQARVNDLISKLVACGAIAASSASSDSTTSSSSGGGGFLKLRDRMRSRRLRRRGRGRAMRLAKRRSAAALREGAAAQQQWAQWNQATQRGAQQAAQQAASPSMVQDDEYMDEGEWYTDPKNIALGVLILGGGYALFRQRQS